MSWSDVNFPATPVIISEHHERAAAGNVDVTTEAVSVLRSALSAPPESDGRITHLLLRAAAGAGKSYAMCRLIADAAGPPGSRRLGVVAFTNNQIRPLAERLSEVLGKERVCLHLSADAYGNLPDGYVARVAVVTTASSIPSSADVIVTTASKLKALGEQDRMKNQLGTTPDERLYDALFVDEAWQLPHHLFDPIERVARVIVGVGDVGQLPPLDISANPWRGDRRHNPYRAWPIAYEGRSSTWACDLPTVWRPPGEALDLWRAFYPSWGDNLLSVAAPDDRRVELTSRLPPSAALWEHVGGGVPTLVEVEGLPDSDAPDVDLPLLTCIEAWLDQLFSAGFTTEQKIYDNDGSPSRRVKRDRPACSEDGDPLVVVLATRNQLVDDATDVVERLREKHHLRERDLVASTVDSWQGRTNAITVAIHPLTGATELDDFNSAFGRLAVACTRATHGLLLVSRAGLDELLATAPPRPGTPFGEPGARQLPRQTHQRILDAFARVKIDVRDELSEKETDVAAV